MSTTTTARARNLRRAIPDHPQSYADARSWHCRIRRGDGEAAARLGAASWDRCHFPQMLVYCLNDRSRRTCSATAVAQTLPWGRRHCPSRFSRLRHSKRRNQGRTIDAGRTSRYGSCSILARRWPGDSPESRRGICRAQREEYSWEIGNLRSRPVLRGRASACAGASAYTSIVGLDREISPGSSRSAVHRPAMPRRGPSAFDQ